MSYKSGNAKAPTRKFNTPRGALIYYQIHVEKLRERLCSWLAHISDTSKTWTHYPAMTKRTRSDCTKLAAWGYITYTTWKNIQVCTSNVLTYTNLHKKIDNILAIASCTYWRGIQNQNFRKKGSQSTVSKCGMFTIHTPSLMHKLHIDLQMMQKIQAKVGKSKKKNSMRLSLLDMYRNS